MRKDRRKEKETKASSILQRLLTIFLIFIFLLTSGSLLLRYSISKKLSALSTKLKAPPETGQISNVLLELNSADNDFQQAILYGYSDKLEEYKRKLLNVFNEVERILHEYQSSTDVIPFEDPQLKESLNGKLGVSLEVFRLKKSFDSLLRHTTKNQIFGGKTNSILRNQKETESEITQDTIIKQIVSATKKKSFFKRLGNVFAPKPDSLRNQLLEITRANAIRDSISRVLQQRNEKGQRELLRRLSQEHYLLAQSQQQLISSNLVLVNELRSILDRIKDSYLSSWEKRQRENLAQYDAAVDELDGFTVTAIIMVLVFVILLIIYIRKASKAEAQYKIENERAIALAEQKSEMLATMSHEIRNPLTTISGSVFLIGKTSLNEEQKRMVDAIKTSSDMLRDTVNDILDMTKVESQQADVLKVVSFTPYHELYETIEAMRFIASRKEIALSFSFDGVQDATVCGDSFRLKQIVLNLVGNAIKFTDEGKVTVKASLPTGGPDKSTELTVSITDTGIGIDQDKQNKLFTKYFQAGQDHSRSGTGLGLYICYQLIKLQNGSIHVRSEKGTGSTFKFIIPYQLSDKT